MHSPPVLVCAVLVSSVVPLVWLVDDESLPDEDDVLSEVDVDVASEVDVDVDVDVDVASEVDVDVDVASEVVGVDVSAVDDDDTPFVLDIESVPAVDALIDPLVVAAVVSPSGSSPLHANRVRPTSAAITIGADPWTERSNPEQKGQRLSLSQT
jgi:hypothetical protein